MKKIFYLLILLLGNVVHSQEFQWLETPVIDLNFNANLVGYSTAADASGNVYFSGFKASTPASNSVMGALYYNKYNSDGGLIFSKIIDGKACNRAMATDPQGNVLMALEYVNAITIDNVTISTEEQGDHYLLAKFDPQGNLLWHKLIITAEEFTWTNEFSAMDTDAQGNIYIGYGNYGTCYIEKYSPEGNKLLDILQEHVGRVTSISIDTEGNIYAAGSCADSDASFAGVNANSEMTYNTYVVKYSPAGQYQWVRYVEDITCPEPQVVVRNPDEVYFSSYLFDAYTFDGIATEGPWSSGFEDFFIARLNAVGAFQWVREVPGNGLANQGTRNFLSLDPEGNLFFAGRTRGNINWGSGITTTEDFSGYNILVLKYNPEGTVLMAKTAGGDGFNRADGISAVANGDVYIAGLANGSTVFDTFERDQEEFAYYPFLTKINTSTMGINDIHESHVKVYPNPATSTLYFSGLSKKISGKIMNMLGQNVLDFETDGVSAIDIEKLPSGTYIITTEGIIPIQFIKN